MEEKIRLNPNQLVQFLNKPASDFTKKDIIEYIEKNDVKMVNFRYLGGDGRLKTLNFVINSKNHLDEFLSNGERVDGSSLFSYIGASRSDLYVIPRFKTAFLNPFTSIPTVDILCSFFKGDGTPLESSPENIILRAHKLLKEQTGYTFEALGELEYYLLSEIDSIYPIIEQKGYHESHPFSKWGSIRREAMEVISQIGGKIKYGHAEVGNIISEDLEMVQHEIEFLPCPVEDAADQLVLAKWAVREIAYKYEMEVSFAPKIIVGQAGSGLHIHSRLLKDGVNQLIDKGELSSVAKKLIFGLLDLSPALTAFGNTVPTSFLRLVPHQEAPTSICWGDKNRSVLIRVPLGWINVKDMVKELNPNEPDNMKKYLNNQTIEFRSPDGSANVHLLLAGMTMAALHGLTCQDGEKKAEELYIDKDASNHRELDLLPASCSEAASMLESRRTFFERENVFPPMIINDIISELKNYNDKNLSERIFGKADSLKEIIQEFLHCG